MCFNGNIMSVIGMYVLYVKPGSHYKSTINYFPKLTHSPFFWEKERVERERKREREGGEKRFKENK